MFSLFKKKKQKIKSLYIFERRCTGCEKCVNACRHKVLGMIYKENCSYAAVEYLDRCVGCGKCEKICPANAVELVKERYK